MTKLTVIEAAREGYAGRATIYRKIKAGLLTTETDDQGTTVIEAAELIRIFGEPRPQQETSRETTLDTAETERLQAENALLRAENADLRLHRDRLMALLEQAALWAGAGAGGGSLRRLLGRRARAQDPR